MADALGGWPPVGTSFNFQFYIRNVPKPFGRDVAKRKKKSPRVQETKLFPNMRRKFWQQDGARPYTAKVYKALIRQMFGNR